MIHSIIVFLTLPLSIFDFSQFKKYGGTIGLITKVIGGSILAEKTVRNVYKRNTNTCNASKTQEPLFMPFTHSLNPNLQNSFNISK